MVIDYIYKEHRLLFKLKTYFLFDSLLITSDSLNKSSNIPKSDSSITLTGTITRGFSNDSDSGESQTIKAPTSGISNQGSLSNEDTSVEALLKRFTQSNFSSSSRKTFILNYISLLQLKICSIDS